MEEMEKILVYEMSENLKKKQLSSLIEKGETPKNILIYDYLIKNNPDILNYKGQLLEQIISMIHKEPSHNSKKYFKFKTPKKVMILDSYKQDLSKDLSDISSHLKTKKELKQLYCLDEIYSELNPNRREKIDYSAKVSSLINSSIQSYKYQLIAQKMQSEINKFEDIINKVDYSKISFNQIQYIESNTETLLKYAKDTSPDFEIKEKIQESKEIINKANREIMEGVDKRSTEGFKKNLEEFEYLNKKDFLSDAEFLNLKENKSRLSDLENILNYFGDSRVNSVSDALKKYVLLISSHNYFCDYKKEFNLILKKQRKLNRKIKRVKLKEEPSFFEFIKRNKIKNYLKNTEKNFKDLSVFYENRYLRQKFNDEKEGLIKEFKSLEPNKNWTEKILKQYTTYSLKVKSSPSNREKRNKERMTNLLGNLYPFFKRIRDKDLLLKEES